jgi:dTDP-4-dehydrorhamnose reductase
MPDVSNSILVLGARGMLGSDICALLEGECRLTAWDIEELDITDGAAVREAIENLKPAEVVNCAAFTDVDGSESREGEAMAVNGLAPGHIAQACASVGARLIHISTDYVFDGTKDTPYTEDDAVYPLSAYGRTKLAGERAVVDSGCRHFIVRTQWLYGRNGKNFVDTISHLAKERDELRVVNDQFGRPTWTADLAAGIVVMLASEAEGVYHLAAGGECSWFDVAVEIVNAIRPVVKVTPVPTSEFPRPAVRPAHAVLDCGRAARELGLELRHWKDALREFLG